MVAPALQDSRGSACGHTSGLQMKPFKVSVPDGICWSEADQFTELAGSSVLWARFDTLRLCVPLAVLFPTTI